eukprot:4815836-Amphidinium_carterae.4
MHADEQDEDNHEKVNDHPNCTKGKMKPMPSNHASAPPTKLTLRAPHTKRVRKVRLGTEGGSGSNFQWQWLCQSESCNSSSSTAVEHQGHQDSH